ncbi:uncharacterized protein LOC124651120 [Lolium rigidum]|uniref:uncharacterized protein LOC124651120 n=1 Tax=Lolium rigidum TaxID=89674 RepID=UPI001F5C3357|nr:uncharacterized protein LOC124651120 [Lolium rigidum]
METLFMQVFEHRDWVEAQMRQQVASSSDSIACSLIAAGSRPPAWLLPQPAPAIVEQGPFLISPVVAVEVLVWFGVSEADGLPRFRRGTPSAANLEKLLPNSANDERLYQNIILFPGTINHNDFCSASASDAFISALSDPFQMQTSLPKLSPEFVRTATTGDAHMGSSSLSTANKSLQIKPVLDSVSCHLKQSGHAESKLLIQTEAYGVSARNNMGKCVTSAAMRGASSEGAQILQTAERNSTPSAKECLDSSCERVAMNCQSSSSASLVPQYSQSHYLENGLDKVSNSSPNYSNTFSDGDACCISKKISCFANPDTDVKVATIEDKILTGIDFVAFRSGVLNTENYSITDSPTTDPRYALYQKNHHASLEFDEKGIDDGQKVSHGSIPWQNVDIYADYDETAQQCQSFNIPIPSKNKSSTVKERAFVGLSESEKLIHLSCNLSRKYKMGSKMKPLCGKYESLAARFEKLVSRCSVDSVDTKWHDTSYDINNLGIPGEYSLEFDDSLLMSNVQTYGSANANSVQEDSNIPLTPSAHKYSLEKLSRRTGSSSECMGSIPERACFQIHEDSNIAEENENKEVLPRCPGTNYLTQDLTDRKPLDNLTSSCRSLV